MGAAFHDERIELAVDRRSLFVCLVNGRELFLQTLLGLYYGGCDALKSVGPPGELVERGKIDDVAVGIEVRGWWFRPGALVCRAIFREKVVAEALQMLSMTPVSGDNCGALFKNCFVLTSSKA